MYALIIGASEESLFAIETAKKKGFIVLGFDGNPKAKGLEYVDDAYVVDIRDSETIYRILDEKNIKKEEMIVVPVPIGRYLITTGAINDRYHLIGTSQKTAEICTDKWLFHNTMKKMGLRNINCFLLEKGTRINYCPIEFPLIIKPRFGAGSRGVIRIENKCQWEEVVAQRTFEEDNIIEECVEGIEYGVDAMMVEGILHMILLRKKIITPPPYRQCVGYISLNLNNIYKGVIKRINDFVQKLVKEIGLKDGIIHADIIDNEKTTFVIEMSARPSGHRLHNVFTPLVTGVDMISKFLDMKINKYIEISPKIPEDMYMIGYFDISKKIRRIPSRKYLMEKYPLLQLECNLELGDLEQVKDGHTLMERGYFIIKAKTEEELKRIASDIKEEFV